MDDDDFRTARGIVFGTLFSLVFWLLVAAAAVLFLVAR